ncbi:MAG: acylneuraminate cytidylyltransferase family protein [Thermodesulfovibrionia bacterium]|nr:acylneuraminate cytidylyltransferase family protein [Thermodesulfovibrionia bacterium]
MYKERTILGIIPARCGSKGLPGKNLREISGEPLIAWSIKRAVSSKYIDRVIVTTDDHEIADTAKKYGAQVPFLRPEELAGDKTPMLDVVIHAIDFLKDKNMVFDYIALLEPTSPLRKINDIDRAIEELVNQEEKADGLVSVGEVHLEHPSIMKGIDGGYVKPLEMNSGNITRRQDLDKVFFPYGVIYLVKTEKLIEHGTFYQERTVPYFIERWQNYEIDDIYDFVCIEAVMNHELKES